MSKELRVPDYLEHVLSAIDRINRHIAVVDQTQVEKHQTNRPTADK
jgi:hypothetical protein